MRQARSGDTNGRTVGSPGVFANSAAHPKTRRGVGARPGRSGSRAFTLIDVLVSMVVIAVLIGLLLPGISRINQRARQVACSSNIRQLGLGLQMYADDNNGYLVPSVFLKEWTRSGASQPHEMNTLRVASPSSGLWGNSWDGLGRLFSMEYLPAAGIFYCPSHHGDHPFDRYASIFGDDLAGTIVGNYQYRGISPNGSRFLEMVEPKYTAIACDSMRSKADFNHANSGGMNVLRADQSVDWFADDGRKLFDSLPDGGGSDSATASGWTSLDDGPSAGGGR